jgi:hypothetical protein
MRKDRSLRSAKSGGFRLDERERLRGVHQRSTASISDEGRVFTPRSAESSQQSASAVVRFRA